MLKGLMVYLQTFCPWSYSVKQNPDLKSVAQSTNGKLQKKIKEYSDQIPASSKTKVQRFQEKSRILEMQYDQVWNLSLHN